MPSGTFFRLPEEKRQRLIQTAWQEFTRHPLETVSINTIVRKSGISRGSFYQYFTDKEELFAYLLADARERILQLLLEQIRRQNGELFDFALRVFDLFDGAGEKADIMRERIVHLVTINPGMDFGAFFAGEAGSPGFAMLLEQADFSGWKVETRWEREECLRLFMLLSTAAALECLRFPQKKELCRRRLAFQLQLLKKGIVSTDMDHKEERYAAIKENQ